MSLTSFLKKPDSRTLFSYHIQDPERKLEGKLKAPSISKNYNLVGIAFDYLLRFSIQHRFRESISGKWIAETACDLMEFLLPTISGGDSEDIINYGENLSEKDFSHYLNYMRAKTELEIAKTNQQKYLIDGILSDDLLRSTLVLAQLDLFFRDKYFSGNFGEIEIQDIQDLRNLITIVDFSQFQPRNTCILNPTFNKASILIGGADADLVIDNCLIDIKTVKDPVIKKEWIYQLVGYYILGRIGGIGPEGMAGEKIETLGIYFSRYGILKMFDIKELIDLNKLPNFVETFKKMAVDEYPENYTRFLKITEEKTL